MNSAALRCAAALKSNVSCRSRFHPVRKARIARHNPTPASYRAYTAAAAQRREKEHEEGNSPQSTSTNKQYRNIRPPRRQDYDRSSFTDKPAPPPAPRQDHSSPNRTPEETSRFLTSLFQPHIPLSNPFDHELSQRIVTHASWNRGRDGHNGRFIFVGRRVLKAFMMLFLSTPTSPSTRVPGAASIDSYEPPFDSATITERLMDTYILGEYVGGPWRIHETMRWTPAFLSPMDESGQLRTMRSSGLYKVRGACVEAIMGGVYHQYGGDIALRAFHTHVLPYLVGERIGLPRTLIPEVEKLCQRMQLASEGGQSWTEQEDKPRIVVASIEGSSRQQQSKSNNTPQNMPLSTTTVLH